MKCSYCGTEVPSAKKTCPNCGKVMSGFVVNNVTGEYGYRDENGMFHPYFLVMKKKNSCLKKMLKKINAHKMSILIYIAAFGVATWIWIYFDPMRIIKLATALIAWMGIVAIAYTTNEIFHHIKDDIDD